MTKIGMHCYVTGKVQGVWFRAKTQEEAHALSITGWVRNLPDGRVEVEAHGEPEKITALHEWLKHGPELAKVENVTYEELPWQIYKDFVIRS